ncbi:MAG: methionyl-tRNA formyltransferase [Ruthenibacterium sp.]
MKLLYMGTPDIAAHCLGGILKQPQHTVCGVFTREDKPQGRKQILTAPPVKQVALAHGIPVWQPKTLRDGEAARTIAALSPELIVVVAYGRILPPEVLELARYGAINLHVSLLPKYRGAAPMQWAIINGDTQTGVSVMQLDAGLDTGDVIDCLPISIDPDETMGELFEKVAGVGAPFLCKVMDTIAAGTATHTPQNHALACSAPPLTKEMALFSFAKDAKTLHNLIRGMNPWPVAYFMHAGKKIKVLRSRYVPVEENKAETPCARDMAHGKNAAAMQNAPAQPGTVLCTKPLTVACQSGALVLEALVPEGSRPMEGTAWSAGCRFKTGDML